MQGIALLVRGGRDARVTFNGMAANLAEARPSSAWIEDAKQSCFTGDLDESRNADDNDARHLAGANDKGAEGFDIRVVKQKPKQGDKELQRSNRHESRPSSNSIPGGNVNNTYNSPD